jgi:HD-GYP domain-containing protein (c-di-GMP phosphodiesterase class II)
MARSIATVRRLQLDWAVLATAALLLPFIAFLALLAVPEWDFTFGTMDFHFYVVSGTALAAAVACVTIIGLTPSLRETRLVFLGLAFLSIASVFAVHGLGTPGHIHAETPAELRVSSWLSVFLGAFFIALSATPLPPRAEEALRRYGPVLIAAVTLALGVYIGLSLATPNWLAWLPVENRALQLVSTAATIGLLALSAWRYFHAFLFTRLLSQWAMFAALVLLIEVQASMTWGRFWFASWWLYHGLYGVSFVVIFTGWFVEARRAGSLTVIAEALSMRDAIALLNRGYSGPIADLVDMIEWKDVYTLGHVRRVATYAVMIGKELGLSTLDLRLLALGAQMHDVGKLGVPDRILTKPGPLTDDEFQVIQQHADRGYDIAVRIASLRSVTDAIRYHHERVDGTGYPEGLMGDAIPLHARIVSIADAFDAMTSGRVYQKAVSKEEALSELRRASGTQFDARCVEAFVAAMNRLRDDDAVPVATRELASNAA